MVALAIVIVAALYAPVLGYGLTNYDDPWLVGSNATLRHPSLDSLRVVFCDLDVMHRLQLGAEYLPVRDLSVMLDFLVWGDHYGGAHATNLIIYLAAIATWFAALTAFGVDRRVAGPAVLMWALHPTHVESVAWLAERKGVLGMWLAGMAVLGHARFRAGRSWGWLVVAAVAAVAAVWSKAPAAFAVAALAAFELVLPARRVSLRRALVGVGVIGAVAMAAYVPVVVTAARMGVVGDAPPLVAGRAASVLGFHGFYVELAALAWPSAPSYAIVHAGPGGARARARRDRARGVPRGAGRRRRHAARGGRAVAARLVPGQRPRAAGADRRARRPLSAHPDAGRDAGSRDRHHRDPPAGDPNRARGGGVPRGRGAHARRGDDVGVAAGAVAAHRRQRPGRHARVERARQRIRRGRRRRRGAGDDRARPRSRARRRAVVARWPAAPGARRSRRRHRAAARGGRARQPDRDGRPRVAGGRAGGALDWARRAVAAEPTSAHAQRTLGKLALAARLTDEALDALARAVALEPSNAANHYYRGLALVAAGRSDEARRELALCAEDAGYGELADEALAHL